MQVDEVRWLFRRLTATTTSSACCAGFAAKEVPVGACGTCLDARGPANVDLLLGAHRSSMAELATWTVWAGKVVTF